MNNPIRIILKSQETKNVEYFINTSIKFGKEKKFCSLMTKKNAK